MRTTRMALAAALLAMIGGRAMADEVTVSSGEPTIIMDFGNIDDACRAVGKPKPSLMKKPSHGKVAFQWVTAELGEEHGSCAGKTSKVMRVVYTSASGYRGADAFKVGMSVAMYEDGSGNSFSATDIDVTVE